MPTILLVDDDDLVREAVTETLLDAGFQVVAAADTALGRTQLELHPEVDLCIVDVVMPAGLPDGAAFARLVKEQKPELPIILMTGYYAAGERSKGAADSLLYKPFNMNAILSEISRYLT